MANVLVTGGAGFIGSHVADALIARGHRVTVLDDLSGGYRENLPPAAAFIQGSITDAGLVEGLFRDNSFDFVFHLAAYAAEGLSHFIKRFNYTNNVLGSVTLINASVNTGVKGFIFTSSIAVYGASPELPMTEEMPPRPEDSYGIAKFAVEQELAASHRVFGLPYIVFRPHNVYGPRQNIADPYRNVVGIFMNQILRGRPMTVFGDGSQTRAFSFIGDVAPVIADSIGHRACWNEVYNIGADEPVSLNALAEAVASAMGAHPVTEHLPPRSEVVHAYATHRKVRETFGAGPQTTLQDGLASMAVWVKRHGARETTPFRAIEIEKNLPDIWKSQK